MSDLMLLLKKRGNKAESKATGTSRPAVNLPPPPPPPPPRPQVFDSALKPIPDLKKKRPLEPEDREVVVPTKTTKQQKVIKDHRNKRASSVESREEPPMADVHRGNYNGSRAGLIAETLEQPLLLPRDMESYRRFSQYDLFMSMKRDLAMITQQVFVVEEWNRKAYIEAQAEAHSRSEAEKALGSLKEEKAKEATKEARRDAQLAKDATKAEKKASYQLGVETTEKGLTEQFASVARDYCDITWGKALDAAGVPADSELRLPKNIFYDLDIREIPKVDAPPPTQLPEVSELPLANQAPPVILEPTKDSNQPGDQSLPTEPPKEKGEGLGEKETSLEPKDQAPVET
ncbi:uncharacterized protein LOC136064625 [Quercus suber]|uniref:uncharacterized protein LOC136064625 n=1 Tax=Quercus suber TaxID=58331 RepID=UPI0032DE9AE8